MRLPLLQHRDCNASGRLAIRPATSLLLICIGWGALTFMVRESTSWAQDDTASEVSAVNQAALSNEDIAQNEERLKRLEEELLKTLDAGSKSATEERPRNSALTSVTLSDVRAPRSSHTEQSLSKPTADTPTHEAELDDSQSRSLKELEHHPVLQPSNRRSAEKFERKVPQSGNDLSHRLAIAESQVEILSRELDTTRIRLRSAENATGRGSGAESFQGSAATRARSNPAGGALGRTDPPVDNEWITMTSASGTVLDTADLYEGARTASSGRLHSSALASVAVESAPLRIGPGKRESALFVMPRHAQVKIEHRTGEWYRVITDAGARGWLWSGALVFDAGVPPSSTVKVGGFRSQNEPLALRY